MSLALRSKYRALRRKLYTGAMPPLMEMKGGLGIQHSGYTEPAKALLSVLLESECWQYQGQRLKATENREQNIKACSCQGEQKVRRSLRGPRTSSQANWKRSPSAQSQYIKLVVFSNVQFQWEITRHTKKQRITVQSKNKIISQKSTLKKCKPMSSPKTNLTIKKSLIS